MATKCTHEKEHLKNVKPSSKGCEECLKTGATGCTCACALSAVTWAAATPRRTAMRERISMPRSTQ